MLEWIGKDEERRYEIREIDSMNEKGKLILQGSGGSPGKIEQKPISRIILMRGG
ncbi:MAG TPA: hypothetical protein VF514_13220 [Bacteroidota bacterium]